MPDLLFLAGLAVATAGSPSADSALKSAAPSAIASAVSDCLSATGASGVDRSRLAAAGWTSAGTVNGEDHAAPLEPFIKAGSDAIIMLPKAATSCAVIARLSSTDQGQPTLNAIQASLKLVDANVKAARSGESIGFLSLPRIALVDASGTKDQPGLRIVVGYQPAEKK